MNAAQQGGESGGGGGEGGAELVRNSSIGGHVNFDEVMHIESVTVANGGAQDKGAGATQSRDVGRRMTVDNHCCSFIGVRAEVSAACSCRPSTPTAIEIAIVCSQLPNTCCLLQAEGGKADGNGGKAGGGGGAPEPTIADAWREIEIPFWAVSEAKKYGGGLGLGLAKPFGLRITAEFEVAAAAAGGAVLVAGDSRAEGGEAGGSAPPPPTQLSVTYAVEFGTRKAERDKVLDRVNQGVAVRRSLWSFMMVTTGSEDRQI